MHTKDLTKKTKKMNKESNFDILEMGLSNTKTELYRAKIMYYIIIWYSILLVDNLQGNEEKG